MKKSNLKYLSIISLLALASLFSWNSYFKVYSQEDKVNIHVFPETLETWTSEEMPITDDEYAILETRNAFARKYEKEGKTRMYLFIVYSESNRKVSHPPEVCYLGSGVTVTKLDKASISLSREEKIVEIEANKLFLEQGGAQQLAYYWFKVGKTYTPSYWKQQLLIVLRNLIGKPSSSALIRISALVENGDTDKAEQDLKEFSKLLVPSLDEFLP